MAGSGVSEDYWCTLQNDIYVREHRSGGGGRHAENECRRQNEERSGPTVGADATHTKGPHKSGPPHRGPHKAANRRPQRDPHRKHTDNIRKYTVRITHTRPPITNEPGLLTLSFSLCVLLWFSWGFCPCVSGSFIHSLTLCLSFDRRYTAGNSATV